MASKKKGIIKRWKLPGEVGQRVILCGSFEDNNDMYNCFVAYCSAIIFSSNPRFCYRTKSGDQEFTVHGAIAISPETRLCLVGGGRSQTRVEPWFEALDGAGGNMGNGFTHVEGFPGSYFMATNGDIDGILVKEEKHLMPILETLHPIFGDTWKKGENYSVYGGDQLNDFILTDTNTAGYDPGLDFRESFSITSD